MTEKKEEGSGTEKGREKLFFLGLPLLLSFLFFLIPLIICPPLFCLNDDLQIRDILSGVLGGAPDLHTVYMRAPLSFILSLLYRILPAFPWFGAFLCAALFVSFFFLLRSVLRRLSEDKEALWSVAAALLLFTAWFLLFLCPVLILPHYTVVAAFCGASGLWLFLQSKERLSVPAFVLLILCDQIRSQVFLMLLPFLLTAVLLRFLELRGKAAEEGKTEKRSLLRRSLYFAGCFLLLFLLHKAAYLPAEWSAYLELNEARTELYDYSGVWESDAAKEYYERCGMRTESALPVYLNYDLLADEDARTERLKTLAVYTEGAGARSAAERLKNTLYELKERNLNPSKGETHHAWPLLLSALAAFVFFLIRKRYLPLIALCGGMVLHFGLYGYLLWNGRTPERVTVSLYLITGFFTAALVFREKAGKEHLIVLASLMLFYFAGSIFVHPVEDYRKQITVNKEDDVVYSYMAEHPQELFLLETYATVYHTAPVLSEGDGAENALLMGGWQYGSPLQERKWKAFGYEERGSLFTVAGVRLVFREDLGLSPAQLQAFLDARYGDGALKLREETRLDAGEDRFLIYVTE